MNFIGEISALATAVIWSFSSFLFTGAVVRVGAVQLNIARMILACVLLTITIPLLDISFDVSSTQILLLSISGFVGLVLGDSFLFKSFGEIGPRIGLLVMSSNPAIAALMAYFILGEVLSFWGILGMIVTLTGISIVVLDKRANAENKFPITRKGVILAFLAAMGQGSGLIFAKMAFLEGDINSFMATFVRLASAVAIMLPVAIIAGKYKNPFKIFSKDLKALGYTAGASVLGPYLGITLSFIAIIYTKVGIASTLMSTMPIIMLPLSVIFYKEKLGWRAVLGAFTAVGGIAMLFLV